MSKIPNNVQISPFVLFTLDMKAKNILTDKIVAINDKALHIIKLCQNPIDSRAILKDYDNNLIMSLITDEILVDASNMWEITNIHTVDVEISSHCNWRCEYCPVREYPKEKKVMSMETFEEIIDKSLRHNSIHSIAINAYNEPTLDPFWGDRIKIISKTKLKIPMATNGSMMDKEKLDFLINSQVLEKLTFNLPSIHEEAFNKMTGSSLFFQTINNIEYALSTGFKINIAVQGLRNNRKENILRIKEKYGKFNNLHVGDGGTCDRTGLLNNQYYENIKVDAPLYGCIRPIKWISINVFGDFFICCNDYFQKERFGNIKHGEISDILKSTKAQSIRKRVFGYENSEDDFCCKKCRDMESARIMRMLTKI